MTGRVEVSTSAPITLQSISIGCNHEPDEASAQNPSLDYFCTKEM
jgi:hypothetical protein